MNTSIKITSTNYLIVSTIKKERTHTMRSPAENYIK